MWIWHATGRLWQSGRSQDHSITFDPRCNRTYWILMHCCLSWTPFSPLFIFWSAPNAANIDLTQPSLSITRCMFPITFISTLANPLNLWAVAKVEACRFLWPTISHYLGSVWTLDTWNEYQRLLDGTINVVLEPIKPWKALTSYRFMFYAIFGYLVTELTWPSCSKKLEFSLTVKHI